LRISTDNIESTPSDIESTPSDIESTPSDIESTPSDIEFDNIAEWMSERATFDFNTDYKIQSVLKSKVFRTDDHLATLLIDICKGKESYVKSSAIHNPCQASWHAPAVPGADAPFYLASLFH
jgi:hypothetical protein